MSPVIYLVVPCYNEEEVLVHTANELRVKMKCLIDDCKISKLSKVLFVNDGSTDNTAKMLAEFADDPITRAVFDRADIAFIDREFQGLVDCNAPEKILKLGKEGSVYYNGTELYEYHTPKIIEHVVDKTGAGDVLSGTFLSVLAKTNNPELALKIANQVATESIMAFGVEHLTTAPLPTIDQGGGPSK